MQQTGMASTKDKPKRRGPVPLTALVGKIIDPVIAARGFANGDLLASWPEIVGAAFAGWTEPERIVWPRGVAGKEPPAARSNGELNDLTWRTPAELAALPNLEPIWREFLRQLRII